MIRCPRCNKENRDEVFFCKQCGANLQCEIQIETKRKLLEEKVKTAEQMRKEVLEKHIRNEQELNALKQELNNAEQKKHNYIGSIINEYQQKIATEQTKAEQEHHQQRIVLEQFKEKLEQLKAQHEAIKKGIYIKEVFFEFESRVKSGSTDIKTTVRMEKNVKTIWGAKGAPCERLWVKNYQPLLPIRFTRVYFPGMNHGSIYAETCCYSEIKQVIAHVDIESTEGAIFRLDNCQWDIQMSKNQYQSVSTSVEMIPNGILSNCRIAFVRIYIDKILDVTGTELISSDNVSLDLSTEDYGALTELRKEPQSEDVLMTFKKMDGYWMCRCGMKNSDDYQECVICGRKIDPSM